MEYIQRLVNSKKTNYNDFVHSIWFCINGARLESSESAIFNNLKRVYKDNTMPIIIVYLQAIDEDAANKMGDYILKQHNEKNYIKVLAEKTEIKDAFGKDELLKETMKRCTNALQGEMIKLMTQKISQDVQKTMLDNNENNRTKVKDSIINEFNGNYKIVKTNKDFIGYIIDNFAKNLLKFYEKYKENISNNTLNLLKNSDLINEVTKCVKAYKNDLKVKMQLIVEKKAKDFICLQAEKEKQNDNMTIEHKRRLKGFIKSNRKYFKQNYYFICQKYIINEIIQKFMLEYFMKIKNQIDEIIKNLLKKIGEEIQFHLEDCFLNKLKNFAEKVDIHLNIDRKMTQTPGETPGGYENEYDNDIKKIESINESYISSNSDEKEVSILKDEDLKIINDLDNSLIEFFQENTIQDAYFNVETQDDRVYNLLIKHIKNDLLNYIYSNKDFINKYNYKTMVYEKNPISKIIDSQQSLKTYKEKIKNEFKNIRINIDSFKIKYLSIILIGKSGVGKSTLINCMLKKNLAQEGVGGITTIQNALYQNKEIPFLRLIDTRGIEFDQEYGPNAILDNAITYIQEQRSKNNKDYNNYIKCVWFCVKGNDIEEKEIEILNNLQKKESNLPIIVVNTLKYVKEKKEENCKIKQKIFERCSNIEFTQLLARSTSDKSCLSYGLDDLLNITLKKCNYVVQGDSFNKMKEEISKEIQNNILKQNNKIKENIEKEIIPAFLNYDHYLPSDEYLKYISSNYLGKIFFEFLKLNKEENKELSSNKDKDKDNELSFENKNELYNFKNVEANIKEYIQFYEGATNKFISSILNNKVIEYLDLQVGLEIKEGASIKRDNKNTKDRFENMIKNFLNNNFHFIAQKHYLGCINKDISESFIKDIGDEIIKKVKFLLKDESEDLFKSIYKKKYEDFKNMINNYRKNNKNIYNSLTNSSVFHENINESTNKIDKNNTSSNKISERSSKISNKNNSITKAPEIKNSLNTNTGNNYDKKSGHNTTIDNISEKSSKITPGERIRASLYKGTEKPEERGSDNPSDNNGRNIKGPEINI